MSENFKIVPGYKYYQVSDAGRVWNARRMRFMKASPNSIGYLRIGLSREGARKRYFLHRLVLETFAGKSAAGMECAHLDGDITNNRLSNLQWVTKSENQLHRRLHGTAPIGAQHPMAKLSEHDVRTIRLLLDVSSMNALARMYAVSKKTIFNIKHKKSWAHV